MTFNKNMSNVVEITISETGFEYSNHDPVKYIPSEPETWRIFDWFFALQRVQGYYAGSLVIGYKGLKFGSLVGVGNYEITKNEIREKKTGFVITPFCRYRARVNLKDIFDEYKQPIKCYDCNIVFYPSRWYNRKYRTFKEKAEFHNCRFHIGQVPSDVMEKIQNHSHVIFDNCTMQERDDVIHYA